MRRPLAIPVIALALAASLAACGSDSPSDTSSSSASTAVSTSVATSAATQAGSASEQSSPVDVSSVLTFTAPEGLTKSETTTTEDTSASVYTSADAMRTVTIAANTSQEDADAAVAALAASGGVTSTSQNGDTTISVTQAEPVTVDGEKGTSYSGTTTSSAGGVNLSSATRGAYVSHNGTLVQITLTVTSLTDPAEVSEADLAEILSGISWK
ncbi:hypothetical protein AXF14_04235 [Actinomyces radicidentis]|uniref:Uncharacterized protein n=1 Tax=Actinomyces radicidentis TaxID=111015 RepID=A0A0X8JDM2_ACTRD|nr:hypothetical protein [Actinomyces radicidentis]AMD86949.1 hypothetical protein AXF14_04235 [Actinomyces radicidentis]